MARDDLFHGHVGAVDTMARALLAAASLLESGDLAVAGADRYAGWAGPLGPASSTAPSRWKISTVWSWTTDLDPAPVSGRQELLENLVNRHVERAR